MAERPLPSLAAVAVATSILAGICGFFIGQASSIGIFCSKQDSKPKVSLHSTSDEVDSDSKDSDPKGLKDLKDDGGECKLVLVVRTDLGMTKGKIAAQCSHATLACYKSLLNSPVRSTLLRRWELLGQAKIALQVHGEDEMDLLYARAVSLGLCAQIVHDAGRTQIASGSATVLGIGPAPKGKVDEVTGSLKLL